MHPFDNAVSTIEKSVIELQGQLCDAQEQNIIPSVLSYDQQFRMMRASLAIQSLLQHPFRPESTTDSPVS